MRGPTAALAALLLLAPPSGPPADDPREVVHGALLAVEGDSAPALAERWRARLERDPRDRAAMLGLATVARLTYDRTTAERRYRELLALSPPRGDRVAGYARLGYGVLRQTGGDVAGASVLVEAAAADARAAGDRLLGAESYLSLATYRARQPGLAAALAAAIAALDTARALMPDTAYELLAGFHGRRGGIYTLLGRPQAAAEVERCIDFARRAGSRRLEGTCAVQLAKEMDRRGLVDSALALLRTAERLQEQARDRRALGIALGERGALHQRLGDYGAAREALARSVVEQRAAGGSAADELIQLGELARTMRDRAAALAYVTRGLAILEAERSVVGLRRAHGLQAALAADAGDFETAERLERAQIDWAVADGQVETEVRTRVALAELYERRGRHADALRQLDSAAMVRTRHAMQGGSWAGELAYQYGRIALAQGRLDDAARSFERYLRTRGDDQYLYRYRARARLAEVYARRGELDSAERHLRLASDQLDEWRAMLTDAELRVLAFQLGADDATDVGVPRVLAALAASGRGEAAFAIAERRRARELADRLAQAAAARVAGHTAGEARRRHATPMGAAAIRRALPDARTALLEYVAGRDGAPTTLFVVTRDGLRADTIALTATLAAAAARLPALLESGAEPEGVLRALGATLLGPALAVLPPDVDHLVVVPDGGLHGVPFEALRLPDGRYAVERFAIATAPSATVAATLWRTPPARPAGAAPRLLALGDPRFDAGETPATLASADPTELVVRAGRAGARLARLEGSGTEVRTVVRYAPGARVRLREAASEAAVKRAPLADFDVVHFATHALVDESAVGRTAIALAEGDGEDGFLTAGEIAALRLDADLVVLSACRTAGGVVVDGEGVQGLTSALLEAGAHAVVATRWDIGDRSAVGLVRDFYDALAQRRPVSEALRTAQLAAVRRGAPPAEWAAFTVVGDPTVAVALVAPGSARGVAPLWLLPPLVIVVALLAVARHRTAR
ncbi:MAG TPA: CHAT domain-containing protein [Gemmatimonadaceae bacterium]|nr:CHAT domain-containing protein [Gemmatimonadaceae bacterium]